jgi:hypothetical protein
MWIPREIDALASRLQNGQRVKRITVRRLLRLFDAERRGIQKVQEIRNALNSLNLETYPDFEQAWIDSTIMIRLKEPTLSKSNTESDFPDLAAENGIETQQETSGLQNGGGVDPSEEIVDAASDDDTDQRDPENEDDENEEVSVGELEQIQFLLGHASVQTTERYFGCKQKLGHAVNDNLGLEDS